MTTPVVKLLGVSLKSRKLASVFICSVKVYEATDWSPVGGTTYTTKASVLARVIGFLNMPQRRVIRESRPKFTYISKTLVTVRTI